MRSDAARGRAAGHPAARLLWLSARVYTSGLSDKAARALISMRHWLANPQACSHLCMCGWGCRAWRRSRARARARTLQQATWTAAGPAREAARSAAQHRVLCVGLAGGVVAAAAETLARAEASAAGGGGRRLLRWWASAMRRVGGLSCAPTATTSGGAGGAIAGCHQHRQTSKDMGVPGRLWTAARRRGRVPAASTGLVGGTSTGRLMCM